MTAYTKKAVDVFAPATVTGAPRSVNNGEVQTWGTEIETSIANTLAAASGGGELQGAWDASAGTFPGSGSAETGQAWIVSTAGTVNGVAFRVGDRVIAIADNASTSTYAGNWIRLAAALEPVVRAADDGTSTANAISLDPDHEVSSDGGQLIAFVVPETNTSAIVTVAVGGVTGLRVKTATGNNPAIGGLVADMPLFGTITNSGTWFQMWSDQAGAAIQAAAEAAQAAAEGFASALATIKPAQVLGRQNTPPGSPSEGDYYIVGSSPTGAWAGHAEAIAVYSGGVWAFASPLAGAKLRVLDEAVDYVFTSGAWGVDLITTDRLAPTVYALPAKPEADLREFMDAQYGVGGWTGRTGVGTGSDIAPAMDAALDALRSRYGRGTLWVPPGTWLCNNPLTPSKLVGHKVSGADIFNSSQIVYNKASGILFNYQTLNGANGDYSGGGVECLNINLESGLGTTTASAIQLSGDSTYQPSRTRFRNLNIASKSGTDYWYNGFFADGSDRTSPQGIRDPQMDTVQVFNCSNRGVFIKNGVQWICTNVGVYTGIGNGVRFEIAGGGTTDTNSVQMFLQGVTANTIYITNASSVFGNVNCSVLQTASTWTRSIINGSINTITGSPGTGATVNNV